MYFDRFDIVEAHFLFYCDHHSGQWSDFYEKMCKIGEYFNAGQNLTYKTLTYNGQEIYDNLRRKYGFED